MAHLDIITGRLSTYAGRNSQFLESRSYLLFEFPEENIRTYRIPFFENPIIQESKRANYVTYNPIQRPSSLYSYTGAQARKFKLSFSFTLDHVRSFLPVSLGRFATKEQNSSLEEERSKFFDSLYEGEPTVANNVQNDFNIPGFAKFYESEYINLLSDNSEPFKLSPMDNPFTKVLDVTFFWINLVRSAVLNNSQDPTFGPPIVRLFHGILYQGVPCICMDYSVNIDEEAGYESRTLMPKRITISMNLEEHRAGDFGEFEPGPDVRGDNVTGWEALFDHNKGTLDSRPSISRVNIKNG